MKRTFSLRLMAALAVLLAPALLLAAEKREPLLRLSKPSYNPDHESVEMFEAIKAGKIDVRLIVKNSKQATVLIDNKTDKPLNVKMPEAFVGVLAQFDDGGDFGGGGGGGQNQQFGGGFGGGGGGGFGGGGGGGGFFNVPPERIGQARVAGVCLEHGKKEPRPSVKYVIKPVEAVSNDPVLKEMLRLFAAKKINQRVAQAAAWHLNSKMSWQELAAKQIERLGGLPSKPYFHPNELRAAFQLVAVAKAAAADKPETTSPGERLGSR